MLQIPPFPTWDSLHPMIIHFPIVLLLLSPLFVFVGAVMPPSRGKPYMVSGLFILLLGTATLFIATSTGRAAADLAQRGWTFDAVLEMHEELGSETRILFAGLSAILLGMFFAPKVLRREENRIFSTFLPMAFLALYSWCSFTLLVYECMKSIRTSDQNRASVSLSNSILNIVVGI